jgi:hypothetical protein
MSSLYYIGGGITLNLNFAGRLSSAFLNISLTDARRIKPGAVLHTL